MTYQRRYAICQPARSIVADMDMDGAMLEEPAQQQQTKPASKPAPKKTVTKKAATPASEPEHPDVKGDLDQPLLKKEVDAVLDILKAKRNASVSNFEKIQKDFLQSIQNCVRLPLQ